jgi:radical SAM protein with 4Fe4S-binding SPASM domain
MLRVSEFIRSAVLGKKYRKPEGLTLIWNLTNRCNLSCLHCYASAGKDREELSLPEIRRVIGELAGAGVRFVILSGGEPLLREDIYEIASMLRGEGIRTFLSTNGLLIDRRNIHDLARAFDYVGISLDGTPSVHNLFRGREGAFDRSLRAIELCLSAGIKTGIRFTLSEMTAGSLPFIFDLALELGVPRIYISHLVYSGRARKLSRPEKVALRKISAFIIDLALDLFERGSQTEVVTGNSEMDGVVLLKRFARRFPEKRSFLEEILVEWGGNSAGERLVCIDHRGNVKPDPFFFHSLGNIRKRSFPDIWNSNGILTALRKRPREVSGRCSACPYLPICNGGSRARAFAVYGDYFAEDPGCYL